MYETGTRSSLEALRRRLQHSAGRFTSRRAAADSDASSSGGRQMALLIVDVQLAIPRIVTRPNLEDTQAAVQRAVHTVLETTEHVTPWQHFNQHQLLMQKVH